MPIVRRSRVTPTPGASIVPPTRPGVAPIRRLRVVRNNAATRAQQADTARERMDAHLQTIANLDVELDDVMARLEKEHEAVEKILRESKLGKHSDGKYTVSIDEVVSRSSRTVDPKRFKASVTDKDFWGCVSVSVTKAEKVLSERELNEISRIEPGKVTGYAFKLKRIERK